MEVRLALNFNPQQGMILVCDFRGYEDPEMNKRRPVVVVSPRFRNRQRLCAVVPLSTTPPRPIEPYHYRLVVDPVLPEPYASPFHWVKADMVYTVSFSRLSALCIGKDVSGQRIYDNRVISQADLVGIQKALLHGIGLGSLTPHL
jgi:uncharacterized protein YifN (PemK superfamily)